MVGELIGAGSPTCEIEEDAKLLDEVDHALLSLKLHRPRT